VSNKGIKTGQDNESPFSFSGWQLLGSSAAGLPLFLYLYNITFAKGDVAAGRAARLVYSLSSSSFFFFGSKIRVVFI
jgi:hypothetical protein